MEDKADKKRRKRLKELKKQRESVKKSAKRGKVVSKMSKSEFIIPTKNGRPISRTNPKPVEPAVAGSTNET
jgi:U3 small nucleolar ribonucleoprotein component